MTGLLIHTAAKVLQQLLVDLSLATLPSSAGAWPIYIGQEADTPDSAITIYDTSPEQQGRLQTTGEYQERLGIQLRIRAARRSVAATKADELRHAITETIYQNTVTISGSTYLVYTVSKTSGPIDLGKNVDTSKRNVFTINATVALRQTA